MAYQTYTTEAIVCGSKPHNTSDRSFLLFTRDAGMVYATARSVREERSRQRYALQDFALIRVSLVRGKSGWRIGSVENETNAFSAARSRAARTGVLRVIKLLRQFVRGEDVQPGLYEDARHALVEICRTSETDAARISDIFTLRLLHKLGYIAVEDSFNDFVTSSDWTAGGATLPKQAEQAIERALAASHL